MKALGFLGCALLVAAPALAQVQSKIVPFGVEAKDAIVLQNDSFKDGGGQAYLQAGFVSGEMAGVWVKVPETVPLLKIDYFRVLMGSTQMDSKAKLQVFFQMGVAKAVSAGMSRDIENAAEITPGPYWNDIPAQGESGSLRCAQGGEFVGGAVEFTHSGLPSVYRDLDGLANVTYNTLYAIPGGWNYSAVYGLRGDWILRVVGHPATAGECQ